MKVQTNNVPEFFDLYFVADSIAIEIDIYRDM